MLKLDQVAVTRQEIHSIVQVPQTLTLGYSLLFMLKMILLQEQYYGMI